MARPRRLAACDGVFIADGAAGLGYGRDAALGGHFYAVWEWEEGV